MGRWLGFDEISSGHRIYWPNERKVSVERSVQFEDVLEGELDGGVGKHAPPARAAVDDMDFREVDSNDDKKEDGPQVEVAPTIIEQPALEEDVPAPEVPAPAMPPAENAGPRRSS